MNYKTNSDEYLLLIERIITSPSAQARSKASNLLLPGVRRPFLITGVRLLARRCSIPFEPREVLIAPLHHPSEGKTIGFIKPKGFRVEGWAEG